MSYSQNNEQQFIVEYFDGNISGRFLEVGAYNPKVFSNTRALVEMGWRGTYIEPSPACFQSFKDEYGLDNPKIQLINAALTKDQSGWISFFDANGDAVGTTDVQHKEKWQGAVRYAEIQVAAMTVETLLEEQLGQGKYDFFNLDVEGKNIELFLAFPDKFFESASMVCIEHDGDSGTIKQRLVPMGYKEMLFNAENIIMAKL